MVKNKKSKTSEEKIMAAARKVFTAKGMDGARMQDIADEAGINKALLHYYFRDKEKLFRLIFLQEAKKFFPKINTIFESELPLFDKIEHFVEEYLTEMQENPALPWFVINEINRNAEKFLNKVWGDAHMPKPKKFLEQIEKEVKSGNIKPVKPVQLLMNMLSMTIFPFIARPMIQRNLSMDDKQFRAIMEERKREIPRFIINAIKN